MAIAQWLLIIVGTLLNVNLLLTFNIIKHSPGVDFQQNMKQLVFKELNLIDADLVRLSTLSYPGEGQCRRSNHCLKEARNPQKKEHRKNGKYCYL